MIQDEFLQRVEEQYDRRAKPGLVEKRDEGTPVLLADRLFVLSGKGATLGELTDQAFETVTGNLLIQLLHDR